MRPALAGSSPRHSLLWRLFSVNTALLMAAAAVLILSPITVSSPLNTGEGVIIFVGLVAMLGADLLLLRRALAPLGRLRLAMRSVDPLAPGPRVDPGARSADVADLARSFNEMLDRLESERRGSARAAQAAQESERRWLSLELHDEIGQNLTALLLQIDVASRADDETRVTALDSAREIARESLERIRTIVNHLRPEALDDLGLQSALLHLCDRVSRSAGLEIRTSFDRDLPALNADAQLVLYRVVQESLTNAVRHSGASAVEVELVSGTEGVTVYVRDNGQGQSPLQAGSGLRGMRERALLIGSSVEIERGPRGGVEVCLRVPPAELVTA